MHKKTLALALSLLTCAAHPGGDGDPKSELLPRTRPEVGGHQLRMILTKLCEVMPEGTFVDLSGRRFAPEQARDPNEAVATIDARQSMLLLPGGRFMLRTSTVYAGDIEFRYRTVASPKDERTIDELGWRDGDVVQRDDAASSAKDYADLRMLVPGLLACDARARGTRGTADAPVFEDGAGRPITLHLSRGPTLASAEVGAEEYRYSGWRPTRYGPQPTLIERWRGKALLARWASVNIRPADRGDERLMTVPDRYSPAEPQGPIRATALGAGAYRVDGTPSGYHTGFVVGTRAIAVFDAPVGPEESRRIRAVIERTAPGVPIAYVVASHPHGDHVAGLPAYADAEVITGEGAGVALRRQLTASSPARLREISVPTELDLGDRTVRLFPIPSSHASTMIVAYAPEAKALFQGDLFYLPERGAVPPAFTTGLELKTLIVGHALEVGRIVGVHGRSGAIEDLDHAILLRSGRPQDRGCIGITSRSACEPESGASPPASPARPAS